MCSDDSTPSVALAIRDTTYLLDFLQKTFPSEQGTSNIVDFILCKMKEFSEKHMEKFLGAAMPETMAEWYPTLCSRLWAELDIVPLVLPDEIIGDSKDLDPQSSDYPGWSARTLDEQAESMGRKVVRFVWVATSP